MRASDRYEDFVDRDKHARIVTELLEIFERIGRADTLEEAKNLAESADSVDCDV